MQHTTGALIPIRAASPAGPDWQPIFHLSNQVVLYNPTSHALSIRRSSPTPTLRNCPYCHRPLRTDEDERDADADAEEFVRHETGEGMSARAHNYFQLLAVANETLSRPGSPPPLEDEGGTERSGRRRRRSSSGAGRTGFGPDAMAEGYFKAFFQEEYKLGMGANGSVYLCQHMLDGNPLGHFAVKKIAVGESHAYLLKILREVRLLERLHHPHIITYHHAWLETCQFSAFGPKVPTLHVLMQWAEGGSLDDFIAVRLGQSTSSHPFHHHPPSSEDNPLLTPANSTPSSTPTRGMSSRTNGHGPSAEDSGDDRAARIRAFRAIQRAPPDQREQLRREFDNRYNSSGSQKPTWTAVHLLSAEEVHSLFRDVVEGLAFLHDKSILHLDLKPGNVLLTWDEGKLVPRAMLSDFGTSRDMLHSSRARSGNTGTLEYTAPESLPDPGTGRLQQVSSQADMWSLGMLLHKLLFFRLPYRFASDGGGDASEGSKMDQLENEVRSYPGFKASVQLAAAFEARRLPRAYLVLLDGLLSVAPGGRPTSERVLGAIREGRLNPVANPQEPTTTLLVPVPQRQRSISPRPRLSSGPDGEPTADRGRTAKAPTLDEVIPDDSANLDDDSHFADEKAALLGLPAPSERHPGGLHVPRNILVRLFKSSVLMVKIMTLPSFCVNGSSLLSGALIGLAITDTLFEDLRLSAALGLAHLALTRVFGCFA